MPGNGIAERPHLDARQLLFKAADGNQSKWSSVAHSVFWAERITIKRRMGCSPYFAATGTHPILPVDIAEANYLLPPPDSILSTTDLIVRRAIILQKRPKQLAKLHSDVFAHQVEAARRFERDHAAIIKNYNFSPGTLIHLQNNEIEMSLNRKMRPRYLGPLIVISRNCGGAYILAELDGSVYHAPVAAFRVIPFHAHHLIPIPPIADLIDISTSRLKEMEATVQSEDDEKSVEPDDEDTLDTEHPEEPADDNEINDDDEDEADTLLDSVSLLFRMTKDGR